MCEIFVYFDSLQRRVESIYNRVSKKRKIKVANNGASLAHTTRFAAPAPKKRIKQAVGGRPIRHAHLLAAIIYEANA
jgi:hypothetical protein